MIKSMTGFGRHEVVDGLCKITVEMKAVNHRYLDLSFKMPKKFNQYESNIRNIIKKYLSRGKVDIYVSYEDLVENPSSLIYNKELAKEYMKHFEDMSEHFDIKNDVKVSNLARMPEVFSIHEQADDNDYLEHLIEEVFEKAAISMQNARSKEGKELKNDLISKLNFMITHIDFIEKKAPVIIAEYKKKLEDKVTELLSNSQIDEMRIATEVTIFADKMCVDEETVRLRSHIKNTIEALEVGGIIGRKLDFMTQEMNREANTISSKSNDLEITNKAIELKTEIEKIREQVQNIE